MIKYETITIIKQNDRGQVCLASMPEFDYPVIVKIRKSASLFIYQQLSRIESIHIPKLYSFEEEENSIIIAEEYVEGESLDNYVKTHSCSETEIISLMLQLCNCMKLLHSQTPPIIHRDLKPQNIIVTEDGTVKIIDFDASRNFDSGSSRDTRKHPAWKIIPAAVFAGVICLAAGILHFAKANTSSSPNVPIPPATESTEVRLPTCVADSFDEETGTSVPFVIYYRQDQPEETPLYFSFPNGGKAPHTVSLIDNTSGKSINIVNEHWKYDRDTYLLHIEDDYLTKLKPDQEYTISCLWDDLRWNVNLYPLSSLDKLETLNGAALSPGWLEFKKEEPHDYTAATVNAFGRKLTVSSGGMKETFLIQNTIL